jgi:hypothetical protein
MLLCTDRWFVTFENVGYRTRSSVYSKTFFRMLEEAHGKAAMKKTQIGG